MVELVTQLALVLALVDFGVNGLHRAFSITVKRRRFLCIVGHEPPVVLITLHFMLLLNVSSQGERVPDKPFSTRLDLTNVDLLVFENVAMIFPVEILRDSVLSLNVVDKIGTELELLLADLAAKNTPVQPLDLLSFKTTHQLLLVVVQGDLVALRDVLVEGEVVTENADATYLTSVPGSGKKATSVFLVVLRHLQAVHPFHMKADLVLRVELSTWLAQLTLKDTLVGPVDV